VVANLMDPVEDKLVRTIRRALAQASATDLDTVVMAVVVIPARRPPVLPGRDGRLPVEWYEAPATWDRIVRLVAETFGVEPKRILGPERHPRIARVRQTAMWLARRYTSLSLSDIGRLCGGRDHTTVMAAVRRVGELRAGDERYTVCLAELGALLRPATPAPVGEDPNG